MACSRTATSKKYGFEPRESDFGAKAINHLNTQLQPNCHYCMHYCFLILMMRIFSSSHFHHISHKNSNQVYICRLHLTYSFDQVCN